ncbi:hypothetical protein M0C34_15965 [Agarivorans sp. TSD2052]|uniref:hypothetical protein n=1 Tax=Agarivorans sp. TSD2052 TaxID=2937286 RepID=UPI002010B598|nr:hypothetical protein [Agarivorans sp. TSD2052]UPW17724.1 hypothetical protein M0C34_15965 [Agarivorans sp. TSD2052]
MLKPLFNAFTISLLINIPNLSAKEIDLSNKSDPSGTHEVALCARASPDNKLNLPGHAFVSFTHIKNNGDVTLTSIGHTPNAGSISALMSYFGTPVSGYLNKEKYTNSMQRCLRIKVNKADYERAFELTESPLQQLGLADANDLVLRSYDLSKNDCITFMIEVADELKPMGLNVPKRGATDLPLEYMERVISSN